MSTDDPIDELTDSVSENRSVDWARAESEARTPDDRARIRGLHALDHIVKQHRRLQQATDPESSAAAVQQWGHLTLLELEGTGAQGEVWRAWDTALQREVALKFLLRSGGWTASDSALLDEARALARVRHASVVAVHGIAEHDGRVGMWMEFIRGTTLAMEIDRRGALPADEVTRIGIAICHALEVLETAGLVHRDIKPANIVLESGGRVVLTDFGLGRRRRGDDDHERLRSSGTPYFMSPELLAGEPATQQSDIYALGVSLRWALTGRPPFQVSSLEELREQAARPPSASLSAACPGAPAPLVRAIETAMAPLAKGRYASAAPMARLLESAAQQAPRGRWRRATVIATAGVSFVVILAIGLVLWRSVAPRQSVQLVRFSVHAPSGTTLVPNAQLLAVSPNGRELAFVAFDSTGTRRVWLRSLESLTARPLVGTEDALQPFWSPDSRQLAFFADQKLKKIGVTGGTVEVLCSAPDPRGGSWGENGDIVFAPVATGPICRISADGGPVTELIRPDSTLQETALRWPDFLPGGRRFLFVALPPRDGIFDVYAGSVDSNLRQSVLRTGAAPRSAGRDGLILASNGRLLAQPFDARSLKPIGEPVSLGAASSFDVTVGQPLVSVSTNGVLAQPAASLANTRAIWLDRAGRQQERLSLPAGRYERAHISPDGGRILLERRSSPTDVDLWIAETSRQTATRFSHGSQSRFGGTPIWSPDGTRVAFSSNREGTTNIYQRLMSEAGEDELLFRSNGQFKEVDSFTPDGRFLVFEQADPVTGWDLWILPLEGERTPISYLRTPFNETNGHVSPDGKWLAYSSDATGKPAVYVRSFPEPGTEYLVSTTPGHGSWSDDGKEILITASSDYTVWSVTVVTQPEFAAGAPRFLFRSRPELLWITPSPDGKRFLELRPSEAEVTTIVVEVGWPALARR